jgi:alginate O-acetyltransferase complex protein AlgI
MFSIQLYFDFSGYSDMAIGLGKIFGFNYNENFKHPYAARSVADFYRRWHMSLGRFLRDYVYIPLGGNRKFQLRNIMIVWLLTGLWHGASWNFVLWGAFFGVFMIFEKVFEKFLAKVPLFLRHIYTLILIVFSRAIFYYVDFGKLKDFVVNLFVAKNPISDGFVDDLTSFSLLYVVVILFCIPWDEIYTAGHRFHTWATSFYKKFALLINILFLALATILIVDDTYNPFIYFRF